MSDAPLLPKHWDLWANYCSQKRREHDPVRHYHPLVRMKHSLLPHYSHGCSHCNHGTCGACGSGGYDGDAEPSQYGSPPDPSPKRPEPTSKPQPPAPLPPVLQGEPAGEPNAQSTSPALPRTEANRVRPLPPIDDPVIVPPTRERPALPKNPLPRRSIDRASGPRSSAPSSPNIGRYFETD